MPFDDDEEKVGYGRPPRHSQFKKGQPSPNPGGRKAKPVAASGAKPRRALDEMVTLVFQGQKMKVTAIEAIEYQMIERALKGESGSVKQAMGIQSRREAQEHKYRMAHPDKPARRLPPAIIFSTYQGSFLKALGVSREDQKGSNRLETDFVIFAITRLLFDEVAAIDWDKEYFSVMDPDALHAHLVELGHSPPAVRDQHRPEPEPQG